MGPVLRPAGLAAAGIPDAQHRQRRVALLEGGEPRQLRRDLLGALRATGERAGPRPAVRLPSEGEATEADRGIRRSGQLRGPGSEQPGRRRRRDGAGTGRHPATPTRDGVWETRDSLKRGTPTRRSSTTRSRATRRWPRPAPPTRRRRGPMSPPSPVPPADRALSRSRFWASSGPAPIDGQVRGTPYEAMYGIARPRRGGGDAVRGRAADRGPPPDELRIRAGCPGPGLPLPDFLALDRAGYCQQFSGRWR